jgi:hypothetical protein
MFYGLLRMIPKSGNRFSDKIMAPSKTRGAGAPNQDCPRARNTASMETRDQGAVRSRNAL